MAPFVDPVSVSHQQSNDGSALLQGQLSVDSAQNQQLQFGFIGGYADPGDEFAPLPATLVPKVNS